MEKDCIQLLGAWLRMALSSDDSLLLVELLQTTG